MSQLEINIPRLEEAANAALQNTTLRNDIDTSADRTILLWEDLNYRPSKCPSFVTLYERTKNALREAGKEDKIPGLHRWLASEATIFAADQVRPKYPYQTANIPANVIRNRVQNQQTELMARQAIAGYRLLEKLISPDTTSLVDATAYTLHKISRVSDKTVETVGGKIRARYKDRRAIAEMANRLIKDEVIEPEVSDFIESQLQAAEEKFRTEPDKFGIRSMTDIITATDKFCDELSHKRERKIRNPLQNYTLGDVRGWVMPVEVEEALGLNPLGPKGLMIAKRVREYYAGMYSSEEYPFGYDPDGLGYWGLRRRFIELATYFGLFGEHNPSVNSFIGAGGAQTIYKTCEVVEHHLKKTGDWNKEGGRVAYVHSPSFRMVAQIARQAGFDVKEEPTKPENNFLPDLEDMKKFFEENKNCKLFIYTPIANPSTTRAQTEQAKQILDFLKSKNVAVIIDGAYIGTGDPEGDEDHDYKATKELCKELSKYDRSIVVQSMSKTFGRTGLRAGGAITSNEELGGYFKEVCRGIQLAESYAAQTEAMAIFDYVTIDDIKTNARNYKHNQKKFISQVRQLNHILTKHGENPLFNEKDILAQYGLYAFLHLLPKKDGIRTTPFDVIRMTLKYLRRGWVGAPGRSFYYELGRETGDEWIRFALAAEAISNQ